MLKQRIKPLLDIMGIEPKFISRLTDLGIDSAEEFVALLATDGAQERVAKYLNLDEKSLKLMLETAKKTLPAELQEQFSKPSDLKVNFGARIPKRRREFEAQVAKSPEKPPKRPTSQFAAAVQALEAVTAPAEINLISKMTRIKNQGGRGTCVAFSAVAVREFLAESKPDLSEQYLYWWCDDHDPVPEEAGTTVEMGFNGLVQEGVCKESTWRYNSSPIKGNEGQGPPPAAAKSEASDFKLGSLLDMDENSVSELKSCLEGMGGFSGRPISFSIPVYNSWLQSRAVALSGQITMPLPGEESAGGHAMVMVGYQDDSSVPGGGFFIIRNSWGTSWGSNCKYGAGYGTIPYKYISIYCWEAFTGDAKPSGGDCIISTASYGSGYEKKAQALRTHRDEKLKTHASGKKLVNFYENIYYSFSPYIADKMHRNNSVKEVISWFIVAPIVTILDFALKINEHRNHPSEKKS